jgi:hypothetical protein
MEAIEPFQRPLVIQLTFFINVAQLPEDLLSGLALFPEGSQLTLSDLGLQLICLS